MFSIIEISSLLFKDLRDQYTSYAGTGRAPLLYVQHFEPELNERLHSGIEFPRPDWVAISRANIYKWKLAESVECQCSHPSQTMKHILEY